MAEEDTSCKVVLMGESGVGKTSIISQYIDNEFSDNLMPTTGATYSSKTLKLNGHTLSLEIWDTIGQEKYRSLTNLFYKEAAIAILVYDITRKETFEEIKGYWLEQVKENAPEKCILAICGNKNDLYLNEQVPEKEASEYASQNGASFFLTSAKDYSSVEKIFVEMSKRYLGDSENNKPAEEGEEKKETVQLSKEAAKDNKEKKKGCC
ncbi:MAG: GTP-binding protein [archaeon]|nr:GTP-binding protein [archaeon]